MPHTRRSQFTELTAIFSLKVIAVLLTARPHPAGAAPPGGFHRVLIVHS